MKHEKKPPGSFEVWLKTTFYEEKTHTHKYFSFQYKFDYDRLTKISFLFNSFMDPVSYLRVSM